MGLLDYAVIIIGWAIFAFAAFKYGQGTTSKPDYEKGRKNGIGLVPTQPIRVCDLPPGAYVTLGDFMERESGHQITLLKFPNAEERIVRLLERAPPKRFGVDEQGEVSTYTSGYMPPPVRSTAPAVEAGKPKTPASTSVRVAPPVPSPPAERSASPVPAAVESAATSGGQEMLSIDDADQVQVRR